MTKNSTSTKTRGAGRGTRGGAGEAIAGANQPAARTRRSNKTPAAMPADMPAAAPIAAQSMDYTKANKARISALKKNITAAERVGDAIAKQGQQNKLWLDTLRTEQKQLEEA